MKRPTWLLLLLVACGSDTIVSPEPGEGGGPPAAQEGCVVVTDCEDGNPCTTHTCQAGRCVVTQLDGIVPPDAVDPNPDDCLGPQCVMGELSSVGIEGSCTLPGGDAGLCTVDGACACNAGRPGGDRYVDPVAGTDAPDQGGAAGACAYKTLTYALSQSPATDIHVAPGTYSMATGETLPFATDHAQRIICDEVGGDRALLTGKGSNSTFTTVVNLHGDASGIVGCRIVGVDEPTYCVDGFGEAVGGNVVIDGNDISGCLNGIRVVTAGREVSRNHLHDNTFTGLFIQSGGDVAIVDNRFADNGNEDIRCNALFESIVGGGNSNGPGPAACAGCFNCPFQ